MSLSSLKWPSAISLSASSNTSTSIRGSFSNKYLLSYSVIISHKRPGVATIIVGLYPSNLVCFSIDMPPTMAQTLIFDSYWLGITADKWSLIYIASSLVGAIINPAILSKSTSFSSLLITRSIIGKPKHKVLPWPVFAATIISICDYKWTSV